MTENELILKIRQLREIEPSQNWVSLTKKRILSRTERKFSWLPSFQPFFRLKPVYVYVAVIFVLFGLFGITQNSLPGDFFYPIKKIAEKSQAVFVSEEQKTEFSLESVNNRLEELTKIAENNKMGNLAAAIKEYQASVAEATKNLAKAAATTSDPTLFKKLTEQTRKLEEKKEKLEKIYSIAGLEDKEGLNLNETVSKAWAEYLIKDLEKRTLTEEQSLLLDEAKKDYENSDFNESLNKLFSLSYPQE